MHRITPRPVMDRITPRPVVRPASPTEMRGPAPGRIEETLSRECLGLLFWE